MEALFFQWGNGVKGVRGRMFFKDILLGVVWGIWNERNKRVFENKKMSVWGGGWLDYLQDMLLSSREKGVPWLFYEWYGSGLSLFFIEPKSFQANFGDGVDPPLQL